MQGKVWNARCIAEYELLRAAGEGDVEGILQAPGQGGLSMPSAPRRRACDAVVSPALHTMGCRRRAGHLWPRLYGFLDSSGSARTELEACTALERS